LKTANADHDSTSQTLNRVAFHFHASDALWGLNAQMALAACDRLLSAQGVNLEILIRQSREHGPFPKDRLFLQHAQQAFVF